MSVLKLHAPVAVEPMAARVIIVVNALQVIALTEPVPQQSGVEGVESNPMD